jgi:hypothetical protein
MIVVKLMGGMGNQMFQYALGRKLSLRNNVEMCLDLSFLNNRELKVIQRDYDLDIFTIEPKFKTDDIKIDGSIKEQSLTFQDNVSELTIRKNRNYLLEGFWQCPKYFNEIQDTIKSDFTFKEKIIDESIDLYDEIINSNSVMIDIRRTDYLNTTFHGVVGSEHVNKACTEIVRYVENPKYFIFSDDIEWCRSNIKLPNSMFVENIHAGRKFGNKLQLMTSCRHFIISNSTFAWWAAWLSKNKNKTVVYPDKWYSNTRSDIVTRELNWIKV